MVRAAGGTADPHPDNPLLALMASKRCRSPVGTRTRFCIALERVIAAESNQRRSAVYTVELMDTRDGRLWVGGVAARKSAKDRPVFFNYCPFCGADISYFKKIVSRKVAR